MSFKEKVPLILALVVGVVLASSSVTAEKQVFADRFDPSSKFSASVPKAEQVGEYKFDKAHSSVNFRVRHMGLVDVPGSFRKFDGKISFDPTKKGRNSSVSFTAEVKSVDTGINARDNHLRSKDFFEVKTFPDMKFESTSIRKKGKGYRVRGNFTMKGVTKPVEFPVRMYGPIKDKRGNVRMGVSGKTTINRRTYGVNYGGNLPDGTAVLSDNIVVDIQIEAVKAEKGGDDDKK